MEKLLSVVIPVYNMEKYVQQTLDSLVCDMMDEMQIIIVNDGSTDGSLKIIQDWAEQYPESTMVIDKTNGGHGSAWNVGVKEATGKYLFFLDSDDWVVNITPVLKRLQSASAGIVFNDKIEYYEPDGHLNIIKVKGIGPGIHTFDSDGVPLRGNPLAIFNFHHCIYRTTLIKNAVFGEHTSYDDLLLYTLPLANAEDYEYSGESFYVYRLGRPGQTVESSVMMRNLSQQEKQRKHAIAYALSVFPNEESGKKAQALHSIIRAIASGFYDLALKNKGSQRKAIIALWTEYVSANIPSCKKIFEYQTFVKYPWPIFLILLKPYHLRRRFIRRFCNK